VLLLVGDGGVRPQIVQRHGQRTDKDDVLAFFPHILGEVLHVPFTKFLVVDHLDVPVVTLLIG
jgi:hypothetical protein